MPLRQGCLLDITEQRRTLRWHDLNDGEPQSDARRQDAHLNGPRCHARVSLHRVGSAFQAPERSTEPSDRWWYDPPVVPVPA